jgi:hypothetical protein
MARPQCTMIARAEFCLLAPESDTKTERSAGTVHGTIGASSAYRALSGPCVS